MVDSEFFRWVLLPLLIFTARILDVSIGTIKIIFIAKGQKILPPIMAFFEIMIWVIAMGEIMKNLDNVLYYLAYGGGFAMGNFVGIYIESKLALGNIALRIITRKEADELIEFLKSENYGFTVFNGTGATGKVNLIYMVIKRKEQKKVIEIIQRFNPKAFISIEDVREASEAIFPVRNSKGRKPYYRLFKWFRKGK